MNIHYFFVVIFFQVAVGIVDVFHRQVGAVHKVEDSGIMWDGVYGIGNFGYLVAGVGVVREVVYQSKRGVVHFSVALQGFDIVHFIVRSYRFVITRFRLVVNETLSS